MALIGLWLAAQSCAASAGRAVEVDARPGPIELTPELQFLDNREHPWQPDQPDADSAAFRPLPPGWRQGNFGMASVDLWFRVVLRAGPDAPTDWMWVVGNANLDLVELWTAAPGQPFVRRRSGDSLPPGQRAHSHHLPVIPLALAPDTATLVYMRVRTAGVAQVPVTLWQREARAHRDQWVYGLNGAYFGLLAGLILYNAMLYFSIRDRAYLYYVGSAAALGFWQFGNSGFGAQYLWPGSALLQHYLVNLPLALGCGLLLPFARSFLQTAAHAPALDGAARLLTWAWGAVFLLTLPPPLSPGQLIAPWLVAATTVLLVAMAVDGLRDRRPAALPFTIAWTCLWVSALLNVFYRLGWLPEQALVVHAPMIGAALEMVLLSFALADRFRVERQAAERAHADRLRSEVERDMAHQATTEKSRFLAAVSHDMRQPLYAITLAAESLERQRPLRNPGPLLSQMRAGLETADRLLDAVMTVARLETGSLQPRRDTFSLEALLDQVDERFGPQARDKGLRWSITPCLAEVATDATLLQRIVFNLVSNAVTYTEAGGVLVSCRARRAGVLLQVWDTGGGLPPEPESQVFERHFRGEAGTETDSGVGLGLVIVKQTALLLGLRLSVRSRPGHGTCFSLWLPQAPSGAEDAGVGVQDVQRQAAPGQVVLDALQHQGAAVPPR
jgi:signal transduction histidine kinase